MSSLAITVLFIFLHNRNLLLHFFLNRFNADFKNGYYHQDNKQGEDYDKDDGYIFLLLKHAPHYLYKHTSQSMLLPNFLVDKYRTGTLQNVDRLEDRQLAYAIKVVNLSVRGINLLKVHIA